MNIKPWVLPILLFFIVLFSAQPSAEKVELVADINMSVDAETGYTGSGFPHKLTV